MLPDFLSFLTLRSVMVFASTAFSLLLIMLFLDIITVDEAAAILKLSPEATNAFKLVVSRVQEVTGNLVDIISQLLGKLLGWAGVETDLSKINVNTHPVQVPPQPITPNQ